MIVVGWTSFGLGFAGIFLPGLPTTIFWIIAAIAFLKTNDRMYRRIITDKRFGPAIKLYVEDGKISRRGKCISIGAMLICASLSIAFIQVIWIKVLVGAAVAMGVVWVAMVPTAAPSSDSEKAKDSLEP